MATWVVLADFKWRDGIVIRQGKLVDDTVYSDVQAMLAAGKPLAPSASVAASVLAGVQQGGLNGASPRLDAGMQAGGALVLSGQPALTAFATTGFASSTQLLAPFQQPLPGSAVLANFATRGFRQGGGVWLPNGALGNQYVIQQIVDSAHAMLSNPPTLQQTLNNSPAGTTVPATTVNALGIVGKLGNAPSQIAANSNSFMVRRVGWARETIGAYRAAWAGWAAVSGVETNITGTIAITATIEYPLGSTPQRLTFGGSATGTINPGQNLFCDMAILKTPIPAGARYALRFWWQGTSQIPYAAGSHLNTGGGEAIPGPGAPDSTGVGGPLVDASNGLTMAPVIELGFTTRQTFAFPGDSRSYGLNDLTTDAAGDCGYPRLVGRAHNYVQIGASGELGSGFVSSHALRVALAQYATASIVSHGINDLSGGATAAAVEANLATIVGLFPNQLVLGATIPPRTTSTDNFATLTNQTPFAFEANRVLVNTWWRQGVAGVSFVDLANLFESSWNSGKWAVTGATTNDTTYTTDGLHESSFACRLLVPSGIDISALAYAG